MRAEEIGLKDVAGGCRLRIRVKPHAREDAILDPHGGMLKVAVSAAPERGEANRAVVALLSETLGIPASRITVTSGLTSPSKSLAIAGLNASQVLARLARPPGPR